MKRLSLISFFIMTLILGHAQDSANINQEIEFDSLLTEADFLTIVLLNHPIARQAQLISDQGFAYTQKSRGGFDPKLFLDYSDKNLLGKNYWDLVQTGLKIPTWYGIEFKTGWEYAYGTFVNPEHSTPLDGLGYAGVSVSLTKGLLMDKRRSELLKAKEYQKMSQNERDNLINDLLRDAIYQYWNWSAAYMKTSVLNKSLIDSEVRFTAVKQTFELGEYSVLDTLEAYTQILAIQTNLIKAENDFLLAGLTLSTYLWNPDLIPLEIDRLFPEKLLDKVNSTEFTKSYTAADSMINSHPAILSQENKLDALKVDKKLKANNVMPKLNLQYNMLTQDYQLNPQQYSNNNYKFGVNFSMPLLLRKERGELKLAKIKVQDQELKLRLKRQQLLAKMNSYRIKTNGLIDQSNTYNNAVIGYEMLLKNEEVKLESGESSLFKITLREIKMFKAKLKLIELNLKLVQSKVAYIHSSGVLYLENSGVN